MQFAKSLMGGLDRMRHIEAVCSSVDAPPPIYELNELVKLTHQAPTDASAVADDLLARLSNASNAQATLKYKALWAIDYIAKNGSPAFRAVLQRKGAEAIRKHITFQGPPDVFKGQSINAKVREWASKASESMYSQGSGGALPGGGLFSDGLGAVTSDASGGVGNTAPGPGGQGRGAGSGYTPFSDGLGAVTSDAYAQGPGTLPPPPAPQSGGFRNAPQTQPQPRSAFMSVAPPPAYAPAAAARAPAPPPRVNLEFEGGAGNGDGGETSPEAAAVADLVRGGSVRLQPSREELRAVVATLQGGNLAKGVDLLLERVQGHPWEAGLRALCALAALLHDPTTADRSRKALSKPGALESLRAAGRSPQSALAKKAAEVLSAMGAESGASGAGAMGAHAGGGVAGGAPARAESASKPAASGNGGAVDLLGGLDLLGADAAHSSAPAAAVSAPKAAAAGAAGAGMGGMDLLGGGSGMASHPAPPMRPAPDTSGLSDLMGDLLSPATWAAAPTSAPAASTSGMTSATASGPAVACPTADPFASMYAPPAPGMASMAMGSAGPNAPWSMSGGPPPAAAMMPMAGLEARGGGSAIGAAMAPRGQARAATANTADAFGFVDTVLKSRKNL